MLPQVLLDLMYSVAVECRLSRKNSPQPENMNCKLRVLAALCMLLSDQTHKAESGNSLILVILLFKAKL